MSMISVICGNIRSASKAFSPSEERTSTRCAWVGLVHHRPKIAVGQRPTWRTGDRYRHEETISTGFVESAINQVVSKRMVEKQQMRWTDRGAHLLLQVPTRVLNEDWRSTLSHWYPAMQETCDAKAA